MNTITVKRITFDNKTYRVLQPYQKKQIALISYHSGIPTSFIIEALTANPSVPYTYTIL